MPQLAGAAGARSSAGRFAGKLHLPGICDQIREMEGPRARPSSATLAWEAWLVSGFDLQNFLPYLINRAGIRISEHFAVELRRFELTIAMWRVLAALWHDGVMRLCDLAQSTSIEVSTLSRQITAMQQLDLVTRTRASDDARAVDVDLSEKGRAVTARIIPLAMAYENAALHGFSAEEGAQLRRLLTRLYGNLDELTEVPAVAGTSR
jgi:DNA-binding MarR family transcriptional regulator